MADIKDHRDLKAWQVAMDAVMKTYALTTEFPKSETYGLSGQMRRAAVSVPSNIAEGQARRATGAFLNHLGIALGSFAELDTQLEVAFRLGYASLTQMQNLKKCVDSGRRLLPGLRRSQQKRLVMTGAAWAGWIILAFRLFA
jgi:four helix bundle protein